MANETMPYDQNHRIVPLLFVTVIVGKGQGEAIANLMKKGGAYGVYFVHGQGTAPNDIYAILGSGTLDKDVLVTVLREDAWPEPERTSRRALRLKRTFRRRRVRRPPRFLGGRFHLQNAFEHAPFRTPRQ